MYFSRQTPQDVEARINAVSSAISITQIFLLHSNYATIAFVSVVVHFLMFCTFLWLTTAPVVVHVQKINISCLQIFPHSQNFLSLGMLIGGFPGASLVLELGKASLLTCKGGWQNFSVVITWSSAQILIGSQNTLKERDMSFLKKSDRLHDKKILCLNLELAICCHKKSLEVQVGW